MKPTSNKMRFRKLFLPKFHEPGDRRIHKNKYPAMFQAEVCCFRLLLIPKNLKSAPLCGRHITGDIGMRQEKEKKKKRKNPISIWRQGNFSF